MVYKKFNLFTLWTWCVLFSYCCLGTTTATNRINSTDQNTLGCIRTTHYVLLQLRRTAVNAEFRRFTPQKLMSQACGHGIVFEFSNLHPTVTVTVRREGRPLFAFEG